MFDLINSLFNAYQVPIVCIAGGIILLTVGRSKLKGARSKLQMWVAFTFSALAGVAFGIALFPIVQEIVSWQGIAGIPASIGAILATVAGWQGTRMAVAMFHDVMDGQPDDDAQRAAVWVPTLLPAGFSAVLGVITNPGGALNTVTAVLVGLISVIYCRLIIRTIIDKAGGSKGWRWFAAVVALQGGLIMIPLLAYLDDYLADNLSGPASTGIRVLIGVFGIALLGAAAKDLKDKIPDGQARALLMYGLPCLVVCGAVAFAYMSDQGSSALDLIDAASLQ